MQAGMGQANGNYPSTTIIRPALTATTPPVVSADGMHRYAEPASLGAMSWYVTHNRAEFEAAAEPYLRRDPVFNTVALTVLEDLRRRGDAASDSDAAVFGWHESEGHTIDGVFLRTGSYPVLVTSPAVDSLMRLLGDPPLVNLPEPTASAFRQAWAASTGRTVVVHRRMRLHRLDRLVPPAPPVPGASRIAEDHDYPLLLAWLKAFGAETGTERADEGFVRDGLNNRSMVLWENAGQPVAMARLGLLAAGVVRVRAVYTPPEHRRHGYGAAVTTAATRQALDRGASDVVLYTDLANPTTNPLYHRLGYRGVADWTELSLG
jgi:GNAT superfamily N-acetyltransferase